MTGFFLLLSNLFMRSVTHRPAFCVLAAAKIHFMVCDRKVMNGFKPGAFVAVITIRLIF